MLDRVKAGAFGEHPAGEDTLHLAGELHLVDLDEGCGVGLLGRRTGVAHSRRHFEGAELDGVVDRNLEMGDAARDLVEGGEYRDRVPDDVGGRRARREPRGEHKGEQREGAPGPQQAPRLRLFRHAAHLLNGPLDCRSGALLGSGMTPSESRIPAVPIMPQRQTPRP